MSNFVLYVDFNDIENTEPKLDGGNLSAIMLMPGFTVHFECDVITKKCGILCEIQFCNSGKDQVLWSSQRIAVNWSQPRRD